MTNSVKDDALDELISMIVNLYEEVVTPELAEKVYPSPDFYITPAEFRDYLDPRVNDDNRVLGDIGVRTLLLNYIALKKASTEMLEEQGGHLKEALDGWKETIDNSKKMASSFNKLLFVSCAYALTITTLYVLEVFFSA